jgi:hypothetical protein
MMNNPMDTTARLLVLFAFFILFFEWLNGYNCTVRTSFQAFQAAGTLAGMHNFSMFMPQKINFAKYFRRTGVQAFPTCLAAMPANQNGRQVVDVFQKSAYHAFFYVLK